MNYYLLIPIFLPIVLGAALLLPVFKGSDKLRNGFAFAVTLINSVIIWSIILKSGVQECALLSNSEYLNLLFRIDGLGKLFAGIIATLWPLTVLYACEYMEGEERKQRFFAFFTISFGVTSGIAFAGNMMTMYCSYELLTLSTLPLVIHTMTDEAIRAGRTYLIMCIGGAAFAFIGMIFLMICGADTFVYGGALKEYAVSENWMQIFYVCAFLGFGVKAAVFPLHAWLPKASVAPTPVTALLHAVAVVKAGVFAIIRLTYYCFGADTLRGGWAQTAVLVLVSFTVVYGSSMAVKEGHFKRRLAYSTVANLSYILTGVTLMTPAALSAGLSYMAFHAMIKIVGFFCAGAVMHHTGRIYVKELNGIGRVMPITFICFTVAAFALSGIPGFNGFLSKWKLIEAALDPSLNPVSIIGVIALIISAILTAMYMFTPLIRAFFIMPDNEMNPEEAQSTLQFHDAGWRMLVPMVLIAAACIVTGLYGAPVLNLCDSIAQGLI